MKCKLYPLKLEKEGGSNYIFNQKKKKKKKKKSEKGGFKPVDSSMKFIFRVIEDMLALLTLNALI